MLRRVRSFAQDFVKLPADAGFATHWLRQAVQCNSVDKLLTAKQQETTSAWLRDHATPGVRAAKSPHRRARQIISAEHAVGGEPVSRPVFLLY